jgi:broad specificity phosphatase PhoE
MTVFHLVRHGEHVLAGRVLAGRTPGVGLSERGRAEIAAVADRFAGEDIAALYASPLQRTKETAEILSTRLHLPIAYRDDVMELDFGEWTGLTFDEVRADGRWELWRACRSIANVPGGESMRQVQDRAVGALLDLHRTHRDRTLIIVSHGDVIRAALLFALGMPIDSHSRFEIGLASVSTIRIDDAGLRVSVLNERPRLAAPFTA